MDATLPLFEPLGGDIVNIPVCEACQSMQTGLIDCTVTCGYVAAVTKGEELLTSITPIELSSRIVLATVMNKDVVESLSAEDQGAIMAASAAMHDYYGEHLSQAEAAAVEAMTSGTEGLTLKAFSKEDHVTLGNSAQPIMDKWPADADASGRDGQAAIDELVSLIETWNEIEASQGAPWERGSVSVASAFLESRGHSPHTPHSRELWPHRECLVRFFFWGC